MSGPLAKPPSERFWAKVDKNGPTQPHMDSPCWVWTGATQKTSRPAHFRYGVLSSIRGGPKLLAHRLAFLLGGGSLSNEKPCVCHRCDNTRCVRFDHLFAGSNSDNANDMWRKGRGRTWLMGRERPAQQKLTPKDVEAIRTIRAHGFGTHAEIAEMFGVTAGHVCQITLGKQRRCA